MFFKKAISLCSRLALALALLSQIFASAPVHASSAIHYVKWNATGANNGISWADAYSDLQSALAAANPGDEIWVAAGTYKPTPGTDRSISFVLKNGVTIYGGFAGTETSLSHRFYESNVTILSGDIGIAENNSDNSYHVVSSTNTDNSAVLDGFTITGGNANGNVPYQTNGGGGILIGSNANASLKNLNVIENLAQYGAGSFMGGNPILNNVDFQNNSAELSGGGIYTYGGSSPSLADVTFQNNSAKYGGGMFTDEASYPTLNSVTFHNNTAEQGGGLYSSMGETSLTNATFTGNTANIGGAVYNGYYGVLTLNHVTISGNTATAEGGIYDVSYNSNVTVRNSIVYGNIDGELYGTVYATYSIVQGGYPGNGNQDGDPRLGPLDDNDGVTQTMALSFGSPAIDAAEDATCAPTDQRSVARPQGMHCDMGAFEYQGINILPNDTVRVSVDSNGGQANGTSYAPDISADGRYVAFNSDATNLVSDSVSGLMDIFVYDMYTGLVTLVSVDSMGTPGNGYSYAPSISADGRYVAFHSSASNLVPADTNNAFDIFVRDLQTGVTSRVSIASNGAQSNGDSWEPSLSADGRYIAFKSDATNLVPGDTNMYADIFLHDRSMGITTRISVATDGAQANYSSERPSISADGRYVAFQSDASNLTPSDTNQTRDIFVKDLQTGLTTLVSVDSNGVQGNSHSYNPSITADGRYITFDSNATNLVAEDTNNVNDVFVHDLLNRGTIRVSLDSDGLQANSYSWDPSISEDGRFVVFYSYASNLVFEDTNMVPDIFTHDIQTGETKRISIASNGEQANDHSDFSSLSADGQYIVIDSAATNLVPGDTNFNRDVFVHRQTILPIPPPPTPTVTTITSDNPDPSLVYQQVNVSVTVTGGSPTGIVTITGANTNCQITLNNGTGNCNVSFATTGSKVLTASYYGDGIHSPSSDTEDHVVLSATPTATNTPTFTPTNTPTSTPTFTPTNTPTNTPTPAPALFQPYINFPVGDGKAVAIGDFNSDGLQDVAMTAIVNNTSQLLIFLQNTNGNLANPVSYATGYEPYSMAAADLNHDGRTDIVTTNAATNQISVYLQQVNGSLAPRVMYSTVTAKGAVATGDLNNDGLTDIALSGNDLGVFTQNAAGTLNPMVTYTAPGSPTSVNDIAIADVNNDGRNDVIKKQGYPDFVVYLQNQNGTLAPGLSYPTETCQPFCLIGGIAAGDVTGDGLTDVVMTNADNSPGSKIAVIAQAQDGSLQLPVIYSESHSPVPIEIADVNQDNRADVLVGHDGTLQMAVFLQQANGGLSSYIPYPVPFLTLTESGMAVGDINHDGLPDVALAGQPAGLVILYHAPSGIPNPPTPTRVPTNTPTITPTSTPTATSTPIVSCDAVYHGSLTLNGGLSMSLTNPTGIPLQVQDVSVTWNNDTGHSAGSDKALRLQQAALDGVSFWMGDASGPSYTITPTNLSVPTGTSTILFSFHQSYDFLDGSERILIVLGTNGCQSYPIDSNSPAMTPTSTPTLTATPPYSYNPLYLSLASNQTIGGISSADEDILKFDGRNWSLFFDGSDVGVGGSDLFAFALLDVDSLLMSFSSAVTVSGISATPQDVLRFDATSLGANTAGTFSMYFDGSDVGFDTSGESIDSLSLLPDGRLLFSTTGSPLVTGVTGGRDEDVLVFTPTSLGNVTAGTWAMYFDGSDVGLAENSSEDVDALDVVGGKIYLSTVGDFAVPGLTGADEDVFICVPTSTGSVTGCNYSPTLYFDGSTWGLSANDVDAFNYLDSGAVPTATPVTTPTGTPTFTTTPTRTNTPISTTTYTATPTATNGPTSTSTPTSTPTRTNTSTSTPTSGPTSTSTPTSTRTPTPTGSAADVIFKDSFEAGNFSAWTASSTNGGNLSVSQNAALSGNYGMQAAFTNTTSMLVRDYTPNAEPRYRARFYFHPNSISMASGDNITLFQGLNPGGQVVLSIQLNRSSTSYQLRARLYDGGASNFVSTSYVNISNAVHIVEVDWSNDGHLTFWIDGVQQANLTGVNNSMYTIDRVRLGAPTLSITGTSGSFYIDNFESRRQTYIGP